MSTSTTIYIKNNTSSDQDILVDYGDFDDTYSVAANSDTSFAITVTSSDALTFTLPTWPHDGEGTSQLMAQWIGGSEWVTEINDLPDNFSFRSVGGNMTFTYTE
ncbi:MAG TPA: hypothetical protein VGD79_11360 [Thermoanaerobaculia bacterium]